MHLTFEQLGKKLKPFLNIREILQKQFIAYKKIGLAATQIDAGLYSKAEDLKQQFTSLQFNSKKVDELIKILTKKECMEAIFVPPCHTIKFYLNDLLSLLKKNKEADYHFLSKYNELSSLRKIKKLKHSEMKSLSGKNDEQIKKFLIAHYPHNLYQTEKAKLLFVDTYDQTVTQTTTLLEQFYLSTKEAIYLDPFSDLIFKIHRQPDFIKWDIFFPGFLFKDGEILTEENRHYAKINYTREKNPQNRVADYNRKNRILLSSNEAYFSLDKTIYGNYVAKKIIKVSL